MDISGKVAIVTGGASGIGKAMVDALLQKKAKIVCIVGRTESTLKEVQDEFHQKYGDGKVRVYRGDVSSNEDMEACFKDVKSSFGAIHIVCNNAAIMSEVEWQRMLQVNLNGVIIGTKLAVEYMDGEPAGGGVIINVASMAGLGQMPCLSVYSASKYAVIGYSMNIADFDPVAVTKKLRVNVLCPPGTETPQLQQVVTDPPVEPRYKEAMRNFYGMIKPYMKPSDLVKQWLRLIEEPHSSQVMFVTDADTSHFIADPTKKFREDFKLEPLLKGVTQAAAKNL